MTGETLYTDGGHQTASSSRPASAKIRRKFAPLSRSGWPGSACPSILPQMPTDEELMIARHTLALLTKGSKQQRFEKAS
jgi:hypothetical protein